MSGFEKDDCDLLTYSQSKSSKLNKFNNRIHVDDESDHQIYDASVERKKDKDKSDRATSELVLDARTRLMLFKMISRGLLSSVHGCISTGKEANVYLAVAGDSIKQYAIKIYKTSILVFKDRSRYVEGEFRFRSGYCKGNPRKMVSLWAEKECRNLKRLIVAGIPCPEPITLKNHVLVLSLIEGLPGRPAPRLKDFSNDSFEVWYNLYWKIMIYVRKLYQECHLVHADLSEYNILVTINHNPVIIDVSQAVEHDHPHSLAFLRNDLLNIKSFFERQGISVLSLRRSFDWVTDVNISTETDLDKYKAMAEEKIDCDDENEDSVFKNLFIPRSLDQVIDIERDVEKMKLGVDSDIMYKKIIGINEHNETDFDVHEKEEIDGSTESESSDISDSEEDEEEIGFCETSQQTKEELRELRKANKKEVKEANREKRKEKLKKHIKKRKIKVASQRSK